MHVNVNLGNENASIEIIFYGWLKSSFVVLQTPPTASPTHTYTHIHTKLFLPVNVNFIHASASSEIIFNAGLQYRLVKEKL